MVEPSLFPPAKEYTTTEAVALVTFVGIIIIGIVIGNLLVILAIFRDPTLKNVQNRFIGEYALQVLFNYQIIQKTNLKYLKLSENSKWVRYKKKSNVNIPFLEIDFFVLSP